MRGFRRGAFRHENLNWRPAQSGLFGFGFFFTVELIAGIIGGDEEIESCGGTKVEKVPDTF